MRALEIEATNHCNTCCLHCPREAITRPMGMMTWDVFRTVVDRILECEHIDAVDFSGMGEPTLNPLLPRFVGYLSERLPTYLTTNAATLTTAKIEELLDAGLDYAIISFNGFDGETYAQMMGRLSLETVTQNIRNLVDKGSAKIQVIANTSVTRQTREHLPEIKTYLGNLGISNVFFSQCHNRGGYLTDYSVCDTVVPATECGRCDIFTSTHFVAWNGELLACCHDLRGDGLIGSLITENPSMVLARKRRISERGVGFQMCENCNDMQRFSLDQTPDGTSLSEWIYSLYTGEDARTTKLIETIRHQQERIQELEESLRARESGRRVRITSRVKRLLGITGGSPRT